MTEKENWCADFFDDLFAEHHLVRDDKKELDEAVAFLEEKLHLNPGDTVFDQCCGVGSLSIALAEKGYHAHGIDLIPSYAARAERDGAHGADKCTFSAHDAYTYTTPAPCDAAANWWTSFGYSPDDAQNALMLKRVYESLKDGAWFTLDYMNAPQRLKSFTNGDISFSEIKKPTCTIVWESYFDRAQNMIVKKWIYKGNDGKTVEKQGGGAKVYTQDDLSRLFADCGFTDISFYGSTAGEPANQDSPRCSVVARKKA